jgi:hypothetical protein
MNGVLGYMGQEDGTIPNQTIPGVSIPQTPAYGAPRPRPAPTPYIQFGPGAMSPEQQEPDIDPGRVNPIFAEAYRNMPGSQLQVGSSAWDTNALIRAMHTDQQLLGRAPESEDYSPGFAAFAGGLQGFGQGGNPLSMLGGALMGYAAEKEAYRDDMAKYQKMRAEQQYNALKDQRDFLYKVEEANRQRGKDQWEMGRDVRNYNRDVSKDRESQYEFDQRFGLDAQMQGDRLNLDRRRFNAEQDRWNAEQRAKQAEMPRQSQRPIYRPYGDIGAMAQDPRQKQAMVETDAKEYMSRKEKYVTDQKEARILSDKVGGSFDNLVSQLDPGEKDAKGNYIRKPGAAYEAMGPSTWSATAAKIGQEITGGPLVRLDAAVKALAQHQKLPGSGVWTDADQQNAMEVVRSGDREGMYQFFKAKRDQLNDFKREAEDYDKYTLSTGGQSFGFDDFRRDVTTFRQAGGDISADKYLELKARVQTMDPEASDIRPAEDEDGKPLKDWVYYTDANGQGQAKQFKWGR